MHKKFFTLATFAEFSHLQLKNARPAFAGRACVCNLTGNQAISKASFIISVKEFCLSSEESSSPVSKWSEMVQMHRAFLPARAALS